jgi:hypothetical protein
VRCLTWLATDQIGDDQVATQTIQLLMPPPAGEAVLGTTLLLPQR